MPENKKKDLLGDSSLGADTLPGGSSETSFLKNHSFMLEVEVTGIISPYLRLVSKDTGEELGQVRISSIQRGKLLISTMSYRDQRELTLVSKVDSHSYTDSANRAVKTLLENKENIYAVVQDMLPEIRKEYREP